MDALRVVVRNQLGRWVVGVQLDLVDRRHDLGARVVEELLEVLDAEVGDTNVPHLAGGRQLLHLLPLPVLVGAAMAGGKAIGVPSLDEVPVREVLLLVAGVSRAGPVHQVEVDIVGSQGLQGGVNALLDTVVPGVVELGGDPDLAAGNTRVSDALTNLRLVAVGKGTADFC